MRLRAVAAWALCALVLALLPAAPAAAVIDEATLFGGHAATDGETVATCDAGAVYVYVRGAGGWEMQDVITKASLCAGFYLGEVGGAPPLAIQGDTLLAGAFTERQRRGAVHVYRRTGADWVLDATLVAPAEFADQKWSFGYAVALWQDWAAVAAPSDEQGGEDAGAVYLFQRGEAGWALRQKILGEPSDQLAGWGLGHALVLADGFLYVGGMWHSANVGGEQVAGSGIVRIYRLTEGVWEPDGSLESGAPFQWEGFGSALAARGDRLAITAGCEPWCTAARVHTYQRVNGIWVHQQVLTDTLPVWPWEGQDSYFGRDLGLDDDTLAVASNFGTALYRLKQGKWRLWSWADTGGEVAFAGSTLVTTHVYDISPGCAGRRATRVGSTNDDVILGTEGDDVIDGLAGNDTIYGLGGNDVLCGGPGDDRLDGGSGDDWLVGSQGADTADYASASGAVQVDLASHAATGGAGSDVLVDIENVTGSAFDDHLASLDHHSGNRLQGGEGADTLEGDNGDELLGEGGGDTFVGHFRRAYCTGGPGFDTVDYSAAPSVIVDLPAGKARQGVAYSDGDYLSGVEAAVGTAADDTMIGDAEANRFVTGAGNDTMRGGGGDDILDGGDGTDTVSFTTAARRVVVDLGAGTATGEGSDLLISVDDVVGSRFGDQITGDGGPNTLKGGKGRDTLIGLEGDDSLLGEGGDDTLWGDPGNDELSGGTGFDYLVGGPGDDRYVSGAASFEFASAAIQADMAAGTARGEGLDRLVRVEGLVGSRFADRLAGGEGNDLLLGLGGADELLGLAGDDVLLGGAGNDRLDGGSGWDAASYELATGAVVVDLAGTATGEGSDTLASMEDVIGGPGADTLRGTAGSNVLLGMGGNDRLYGLNGNDHLDGGAGTDTLDGGSGSDFCLAGESHTACEFFEVLTGAIADLASRLEGLLGGLRLLPEALIAMGEEGG